MACRGNGGLVPLITSELGGVDGSKNVPVTLSPGKYASTHRTVGWMGTRAVLCGFGEEKISYPVRIRTPNRPAGIQSLHRLRCSAPWIPFADSFLPQADHTSILSTTVAQQSWIAFNKKKTLFTSKLDLNLRKKLVKCYIWSMALYGAETWTLRAADQK